MLGRRSYSSNFGVWLLLLELSQISAIQPVTLGIIIFNVAVYLGLVNALFATPYPHLVQVCAGLQQVLPTGEYWRLVTATFYHGNDMHLYYNMMSFLWKAITLEKRFGSKKFLWMLTIFSVLVSAVLLALNYGLFVMFQDPRYLSTCAVGFSGVVFAVKVVTTQLLPSRTVYLFSLFPLSSRLTCWFELILIQVLVPNASFTGHLAGILVGLAFTKTRLAEVLNWFGSDEFPQRPSYIYVADSTGEINDEGLDAYTGGLSTEEQTRIALEESARDYREQESHLNEGDGGYSRRRNGSGSYRDDLRRRYENSRNTR